MDNRQCKLCGSEEGLCEVIFAGEKMLVCESCFNDVSDANEASGAWETEAVNHVNSNHIPQKEKMRRVTPVAPTKDSSDTGRTKITNKDETLNWTQIFKIVNFILLAVFVVAGIVVGSIVFGELLDAGFIIGVPIGAVAGALAGMAVVSFSMVIVEISQKLSAILEELKISNKKK